MTLTPECPLDGEWDENGEAFCGGGDGNEGQDRDPDDPNAAEARAEALNDTLRSLDRWNARPRNPAACRHTSCSPRVDYMDPNPNKKWGFG